MAKLTVFAGSEFSLDNMLVMFGVVESKVQTSSPTKFTAANEIDHYVVGGSAMTYKNGYVTSGIMKSEDWFVDGQIQMQLRGANVGLKALNTAFDTSVDAVIGIIKKTFSGADIISGSSSGEEIGGFAGNDKVYGNGGNDTVAGDVGSDEVFGGAGNDIVYGEGGITVGGNDTLHGGAGNDTLAGGLGMDTIFGDAGADTIEFFSSDYTTKWYDTWMDFSQKQGDKIDLRGEVSNFHFLGTSAFNVEIFDDQIRYEVKGNNTFVEVWDSMGNPPAADFMIKLAGKHVLTADDFIV